MINFRRLMITIVFLSLFALVLPGIAHAATAPVNNCTFDAEYEIAKVRHAHMLNSEPSKQEISDWQITHCMLQDAITQATSGTMETPMVMAIQHAYLDANRAMSTHFTTQLIMMPPEKALKEYLRVVGLKAPVNPITDIRPARLICNDIEVEKVVWGEDCYVEVRFFAPGLSGLDQKGGRVFTVGYDNGTMITRRCATQIATTQIRSSWACPVDSVSVIVYSDEKHTYYMNELGLVTLDITGG